jgi:hypothetical protein
MKRLGLTSGEGRYYLLGLGFALLGIVVAVGLLQHYLHN